MTKILFAVVALLFVTSFSYAQKSAEKPKEDAPSEEGVIYMVVEQMPEYPGGIPGLHDFLKANLKYPKKARNAKVQGTIFVGFVVNHLGEVTDVQVLKGIGYGCDEEAVRVTKLMPNWTPGKQDGSTVAVRYTLPIKFSL